MIRQLLEEVKSAPLDEASRNRLKEIHKASVRELEAGLAPELVEELERLALPFSDDQTPSEGELRIAQAQLVGWLEGLFHGIQTAIYAPADGGACAVRADASRAADGARAARPGSRTTSSRPSRATPEGCTSRAGLRREAAHAAHDHEAQQPDQHQGGAGRGRRESDCGSLVSTGVKTAVSGGGWTVVHRPSRSTTCSDDGGSLIRVPLGPPAIHGWPVPVTKNMYSVSTASAPRLHSTRLRSVCTVTVSVVTLPW